MAAESDDSSKIYIDDDWKKEAAEEKERLAKEQEKAHAEGAAGAGGAPAEPGFYDLLNAMAMQAAVALGGFQAPGGETIPPNPPMAKHQIDLLGVLESKTKGNLSDEEQKTLDRVLYELRMQYVQMVSGPAPDVGQPPTE